MKIRSVLIVLANALVVAACTPDPPSRAGAVGVIAGQCEARIEVLDGLASPGDIFELDEVADEAFGTLSRGLGDHDGEGLSGVDDDDVQLYLDGAVRANNAMAGVSLAAGFEDVAGLESALDDAEIGVQDLDVAAAALDLPPRCGGEAWGEPLFRRAAEVAAEEAAAMAPTSDYRADVVTYCGRFRRSLDRAPSPGDLDADRRYAFVLGHTMTRFLTRLEFLEPSADSVDAHTELLDVLGVASEALEESETLAIDGQVEELNDLVEETQESARRVDVLLARLGADC